MFPTLPIPKMSFQASPCQTQADRPPLDGLPIDCVPRYTLLSRKRSGTYQSLDCREQLFKSEEQDDWELPWFVDEYARCARKSKHGRSAAIERREFTSWREEYAPYAAEDGQFGRWYSWYVFSRRVTSTILWTTLLAQNK